MVISERPIWWKQSAGSVAWVHGLAAPVGLSPGTLVENADSRAQGERQYNVSRRRGMWNSGGLPKRLSLLDVVNADHVRRWSVWAYKRPGRWMIGRLVSAR